MLTKKQFELLKLIEKRINSDGISPSFEEMKEALNLRSKSGIHRLISALEERGFIKKLANKARALEILKVPSIQNDESISGLSVKKPHVESNKNIIEFVKKPSKLPVMGKIAAGTPIEAINEFSHHISVPHEMLSTVIIIML